jgi:dTDP-4-dehydrorhamnose reductase
LKILLTGGNGQVGWELRKALAPLGEVIQWPLAGAPVVADKDRRGTPLATAETYP